MLLPLYLVRLAASAFAAVQLVIFSPPPLAYPAHAQIGYDESRGILRPCPADKNCVSSSFSEPPNRYMSRLAVGQDSDDAFLRAVRDLSSWSSSVGNGNGGFSFSLARADPIGRYIHLTTPGTSPGSLDDVELLFAPDSSTVGVRCEAQVTLPPPPFCLERNCINGNLDQRRRVEAVARVLGLPPSDQVQMQRGARWTPIFFNADRVPGFNDDDDETMRGTKVVFVRHWYGRLAKQTR